jgi:hypothetical protein
MPLREASTAEVDPSRQTTMVGLAITPAIPLIGFGCRRRRRYTPPYWRSSRTICCCSCFASGDPGLPRPVVRAASNMGVDPLLLLRLGSARRPQQYRSCDPRCVQEGWCSLLQNLCCRQKHSCSSRVLDSGKSLKFLMEAGREVSKDAGAALRPSREVEGQRDCGWFL